MYQALVLNYRLVLTKLLCICLLTTFQHHSHCCSPPQPPNSLPVPELNDIMNESFCESTVLFTVTWAVHVCCMSHEMLRNPRTVADKWKLLHERVKCFRCDSTHTVIWGQQGINKHGEMLHWAAGFTSSGHHVTPHGRYSAQSACCTVVHLNWLIFTLPVRNYTLSSECLLFNDNRV